MLNNVVRISKKQQLLHKVVMVNGFPGSGKTMLSPIIATLLSLSLWW